MHAFPEQYLKRRPLRSTGITRLQRYYGSLGLPRRAHLLPHGLGLSEGAFLPEDRAKALPRYHLFLISDSKCAQTPGGSLTLALPRPRLLPARDTSRSAIPNRLFFGAHFASGPASPGTFIPRPVSCLRINPHIAVGTARLDTVPVANGYTGGRLTHWNTRQGRAATVSISPTPGSPLRLFILSRVQSDRCRWGLHAHEIGVKPGPNPPIEWEVLASLESP